MKEWGLIIFRGLGQVMLQNHAGTGLLFAIGIAINSPLMSAAALLGSLGGSLTAKLLRYPAKEISQGLYGFNGALVALALTLFPLSWLSLTVGLVGIALSTLVMHFLIRRGIPAFTSPFVIVTWTIFESLHLAGIHPLPAAKPIFIGGAPVIVDGIIQGFGQIMFQGDMWTELGFAVGVILSSRRAALWGTLGSATALLIGVALGWPHEALIMGIYGFNAVLTGIALSGRRSDWLSPVVGIVLSVFLMKGMLMLELPTLTAPFILATWSVLAFHHFQRSRVSTTV